MQDGSKRFARAWWHGEQRGKLKMVFPSSDFSDDDFFRLFQEWWEMRGVWNHLRRAPSEYGYHHFGLAEMNSMIPWVFGDVAGSWKVFSSAPQLPNFDQRPEV